MKQMSQMITEETAKVCGLQEACGQQRTTIEDLTTSLQQTSEGIYYILLL
jgi:hypothetical protein